MMSDVASVAICLVGQQVHMAKGHSSVMDVMPIVFVW